jgi:SP family sugar porter-like MFS transporter
MQQSPAVKVNLAYLSFVVLISALGGLMFGYDWVVIGGAKPFYELYFHVSDMPYLQGWAMSSALAGCVLGALVAGALGERFGRKRPLIFSGALFLLSLYGTGQADAFTGFIFYRIISGVGIGMAAVLSPIYIAEISPARWRGKLVAINQLNIVVGILLAQVINYLIAAKIPEGSTPAQILESWNGQTGWRWMFWSGTFFAAAFFTAMFFVPESPRWLVKRQREKEAAHILSRVAGASYAQSEVDGIKRTMTDNAEKPRYSNLLKPGIFKILLLGIFIASGSQLCGINILFNYADEIFRSAGYGINDMLFNILLTGSINLIFTFIALGTIDLLGRRKLILLGFGGLALLYIVLGSLYFYHFSGMVIVLVIVSAIALFAMTVGPVSWVLLAEIFPNKLRGLAVSVATVMLWFSSFITTFFFPLINKFMGTAGTFWLFGSVCLLAFIFIFFRLPETKNKSLEEIEDGWKEPSMTRKTYSKKIRFNNDTN